MMEIHHLSVQVISIGRFKDRFDYANTRHCLVYVFSLSLLPTVIVGDEGANPSRPPIISPGGHFIISKDRID